MSAYFSQPISQFTDGAEYPSIEGIRVFVVTALNGIGHTQAKVAGGAMSSINPAGEKVIVMTQELVDDLGDLAEVALYHEIGHHRSGEIEKAIAAGRTGFLVMDEHEADKAAIEKFGKEKMFSAFNAIARHVGRTIFHSESIGLVLFYSTNMSRAIKLINS